MTAKRMPRIWDSKNKEMLYPYSITITDGKIEAFRYISQPRDGDAVVDVVMNNSINCAYHGYDDIVLMQPTEMVDSYGVPIYEGDIVEIIDKNHAMTMSEAMHYQQHQGVPYPGPDANKGKYVIKFGQACASEIDDSEYQHAIGFYGEDLKFDTKVWITPENLDRGYEHKIIGNIHEHKTSDRGESEL